MFSVPTARLSQFSKVMLLDSAQLWLRVHASIHLLSAIYLLLSASEKAETRHPPLHRHLESASCWRVGASEL